MAGRRRRGRGGSNAKARSDRSGVVHPLDEMVIEPGTGWLVHYSESDGEWNLVDHPLNHIQRYVEYGDPFPVDQARPEQDFTDANPLSLVDFNGLLILTGGPNSEYLEIE